MSLTRTHNSQQSSDEPRSPGVGRNNADVRRNRAWQSLALRPGTIQRKETGRADTQEHTSVDPSAINQSLSASGQALDGKLRVSMEQRLGHDFSDVRLHTDAQAAASADTLNANAYTFGSDIVFAAGAFTPATPRGQRLLAHELTHVAQQRGHGPTIAPQSANSVSSPSDAAEREADAAADAAVAGRNMTVTAAPPAGQVLRDTKEYQTEGVKLDTADMTTWAGRSYWGQKLGAVLAITPVSPADTRLASGEERDAVYSVIWTTYQSLKPVKTETERTVNIPARGTAPALTYLFTFNPPDATDKRDRVKVEFEPEASNIPKPTTITPPTGYSKHDYGDLKLEDPAGKEKAVLGAITLPTGIPADELIPVKYTIFQYFQNGTRNTEVDAIVPIPGATPKRVFYTLKFHGGTNAVDVERIGEEGKAGIVDPAKFTFDLARIPDYAANSKDVATLTSWLKKRYPTITAKGADVAAVKAAAEADIATGAVKKDWFKNIYGMEELDAIDAATRLGTVEHWDPDQVVGTKDFTPNERLIMERAFEMLSDSLLALVKGTPLARQRIFIEKGGTAKTPTYTPIAKTSGFTATYTTTSGTTKTVDRTLVLFDNWFVNDQRLFSGGTGNVTPASLQTPLHEVGHVIEDQAGIKAAFEKKFTAAKSKLKVAPITSYAKSEPGKEFFPEAFALYHADPRWMETNLPDMYAWFQTLSSTGKVPP